MHAAPLRPRRNAGIGNEADAATAATATEAAERRGSKKLSALFEPSAAAIAAQCLRCRKNVYATERAVASNGSLFHKMCFTCKQCNAPLSINTHRTNQNGGGFGNDSDGSSGGGASDIEIYCSAHEPVVASCGVGIDSRGIVSALEANRLHDRWKKIQTVRGPRISTDASFIRHALDSQALNSHADKPDLTHHMYPPVLLQQRDKLLEELKQAQAELEQEQRREEEKLLSKFLEQRQKVEQQVQRDAERDWEAKLHDIARRLESLSTKNKHEDYNMEKARLESDARRQVAEQRDLNLKMRTLRIVQQQQDETSLLVERQSERMLEVVGEAKRRLQLHQPPPPPHGSADSGTIGAAVISGLNESVLEERRQSCREPIITCSTQTSRVESTPLSPPAVRPPRTTKAQLYKGQTAEQVFRELDEYAINIAAGDHGTFTELVADLTEDLLTDLAKVRAIYRWITVKDLNTMKFHDLKKDSPMGLLKGIKYGTETYHTLFKRLCSYVGLHCVEVNGKAKSVGYEPGMKFEGDTFRNTWNAVYVDGDWRLVQCNWGARHIVLNKDAVSRGSDQQNSSKSATADCSDDNVRYQYDDHYFLTDPRQFIMEFFPNDAKWQLLDEPITLQQFEERPFVRSIFFKLNLTLLEPFSAVVRADETGFALIRLGLPPDAVQNNDIAFHYQLRLAARERSSETTFKGIKLDRFVFQALQDSEVVFKVHVPSKDDYFIEIFANKFATRTADDESTAKPAAPLRLKCACKFRIACDKLQSPSLSTLPNCAAGEWGPAKARRLFQLRPLTHTAAVVEVDESGQLELRLAAKHDHYFRAKLRANGVDDRFLEQLVQLQSTAGSELVVRLLLPEPGQYGLDLYARPRSAADASGPTAAASSQPLSHACKYLLSVGRLQRRISIGAARLDALLPIEEREFRWGAQPVCARFGVSAMSHPEARMRCAPDDSVQIDFRSTLPTVVLSAHFARLPHGDDERDELSVCRTSAEDCGGGDGVFRLTAVCRRPGDYLLAVIAYERSDNQEAPAPATCLFNYLLLCSSSSNSQASPTK